MRSYGFTKVLKYPHAYFLVLHTDSRIVVLPIDLARLLLHEQRTAMPELLGKPRRL